MKNNKVSERQWRRIACLSALLIGFVMPSLLGAGHFRYESRGRRDPFVPLIGKEKPTVVRLEDVIAIEDVRLEGIAIGASGRTAIINGEILRENSRVGEIEIKKITKNSVALLMGGKQYEVSLLAEGGNKSE